MRRIVVLALALAAHIAASLACARAARPLDREAAFVGYSERTRETFLKMTFPGRGDLGAVKIRLRRDWAPTLVRTIEEEVTCDDGCEFYRAEATPAVGAVDGYGGPGPPYALLQGRFVGVAGGIEGEAPVVERGYACLIGKGPDFFIAVRSHEEWGRAHAVFGVVESGMETVDRIAEEFPRHRETWGQTNVTVLDEKLSFTTSIVRE